MKRLVSEKDIAKLCLVLANEADRPRLFQKLIEILIESTGAHRCAMLLKRGGVWQVVAQYSPDSAPVCNLQSIPVGKQGMQGVPLPVPTTIIHAVIRSGENLILEDPASSPRFSHDPYFAQNQSSSVLCMPLIHQGKISGVVYLEVNLPLDTFTPERLQHLKMILDQAAISIEKADRYEFLEKRLVQQDEELTRMREILEAKIGEHRRAELNFQASQKFARTIAENTGDIIWVLDLTTRRFTYVSPAVKRLRGYSPEEIISAPLQDALTPESLQYIETDLPKRLEAFYAGDQNAVIQTDLIQQPHRDGSIVFTETVTALITDRQGRVVEVLGISHDIGERTRYQEAMQRSEHRYRTVFENTGTAMAVFEADGTLSLVNDEFVHLTGYQKDELEGRMSLWDFVQPEQVDRIRAYHRTRRVDLSKAPRNYVFHLVDKSGIHREIYATVAMLPDSNSNIASWIDISQQKRLEEFTRGTLNSLKEHIAILDPKGVILSVNRAWEEFSRENGGDPAKTGPEVNYLEICYRTTGKDQESARQFAEGIRKVLDGETEVFALEYPCHSKQERRWFLGRITSFKMGGSIRAVVSHENITQLKEVENTLRTNETLYRAIIDNQAELVCRYLPDTTLTFTNAAYCRYFGRDSAEMVGRRFLDFIPEDQHAEVLEYIRTLKQNLTPVTYEHQVLTPSGELRWQRWTDYPIFDLNANLKEFQAVGTDITEQKLAQEAVTDAHRQVTTLLEISGKLLSTLEFEPLLDLILDQLSKVLSYDGAVIMTLRHRTLEFQVYRGSEIFKNLHKVEVQIFQLPVFEPLIKGKASFYIEDIQEEMALLSMLKRTPEIPIHEVMELGSWLGLPLLIQDQIIGFLILAHSRPHFYSAQDRDLAQAFANQVALALNNAQLYQQAQQAAVIEERNRLARELHDSVAQMLYSMNLYSKASRLALSAGKIDIVEENLAKLAGLTRDAMSDMRQLLFELRPMVLEQVGLVNSLEDHLEAVGARVGIMTEFQVEGEIELNSTIETELYRIAQEALTNVIKHARATHVRIELKNEDGLYSLTVQDDGIGFDPVFAVQGGGLGLRNIRDRARAIGGKFLLETSPGQGTVVKVQLHV